MPFYTQASCHFAPFGLLKHSVQVSSKQDEQDSAEWMSMSCCCSPVVCQCCSEPHQSLTSVSVQHGQPPSPPLSLALSSSTIPPISLSSVSLSSHTWKPAWLMPVRGTSFNMKMRKVGVGLPDKTNEHIQHTLLHIHLHINTPTSSHCMGQRGSLKVRDWSLLFSSGCLSVSDSFLWGPASTHKYHV